MWFLQSEGFCHSGCDFLSSHKFLRFLVGGRAWCFQALCFILSSVPEVFAQVMLLCPLSSSSQACGYCIIWTTG